MILASSKNLFNFFIFRRFVRSCQQMSNMPKLFVKHVDQEDTMKITFVYGNSDLPDRCFTFMRPKKETLQSALLRIKSKIQGSVHQKRSKRKKKKSETESAELPPLDIMLTKDGEILNDEMKNTEAWVPGVQVKVNDTTYEISENPPEVSHLSLPKNIMSGFLVYPKISLEFSCVEDSIFKWYRLISKSEKKSFLSEQDNIVIKNKNDACISLAEGFYYMTQDCDIGHKLLVTCVPKCNEKFGVEIEALSPNPVSAGPEKCPFEDRHKYTKDITKPDRLRCISYNILADLYADTDTARNELFAHCPTEALSLDYRRQLYLKEIAGYNGDIICLQEVDKKVFHDDLLCVLSSKHLQGVLNLKGGQVAEGLACFYRSTKFKLLDSCSVVLSEAIKTEPVLRCLHKKILENEKLMSRFSDRATVLQITLLESLEVPGRRILIGNTHLYFHPESDNIRLLQAACCILYLENLRYEYQKLDYSSSVSVILMGDFNSCPEFGVYELMTKGFVSKECPDWKSNPEELVNGLDLSHTLLLSSAYGTPAYTNYTEGFNGCLDYIFYDKSSFKVLETVPFPTHEQVTEYKALPNKVFPSDHLALICTLTWK